MKTQKCIACGRETVSVIKTEEGHICYNCYSDKKNPPKQKQHHDEFKTSKGKQSAEQKEYQRQVEMAGSKYVIVRSVEQAIRVMQLYLL